MTVLFIAGGILLGVLAWIDVRTKKIPLLPVGVLAVMMLGMRILSVETFSGLAKELPAILAGLLPGGIGLLFSVVTDGKVGAGDGLVLAAIGLGIGFYRTMFLWSMALCVAAVWAMLLLALKKAGRKTELPFVPCLFLGYVLCQVAGG